MMTPVEQVVILIEAVVICLCLIHCMWTRVALPTCCRCARTGLRKSCHDAWNKIVTFVRQTLQRDNGILAKGIAEQMKVFRLRKFFELAVWLGPWFGLFWLGRIFRKINEVRGLDCGEEQVLHQFMLFGCFYIFTHLVASGCVKMRIWMLDVMYLACVGTTIYNNIGSGCISPTNRFLMQVLGGIPYMDYWKSIPLNLVVLIVTLSCYDYSSAQGERENERSAFTDFIRGEIFVFIGASVSFFVVQGWMQARIRMQIIAQNQQRATQKFAACNCDALCWLAPDLHLTARAPQLASLLFMEDAHNDLKGHSFENYVATDSDKDRFRDQLAMSMVCSPSEGLPMLLHMDLRDATGRTFAVEVFHSCYVDDNDRIGHIVGISESSARAPLRQEIDEQSQAMAPLAIPTVPEDAPVGRATCVAETVDRPPSAGSVSLTADGVMSFVPVMPEHQAPAPVSVVFDAMTFEILGCTTGFTALLGPLVARTSVRSIIVNFPGFLRWLHHIVNVQHHAENQESLLFDIIIAPPTLAKRSKFEFHGRAEVVEVGENVRPSTMGVEGFEGCEDEEFEMLCILTIVDAVVRWIGPPQKKKNTNKSDQVKLVAL